MRGHRRRALILAAGAALALPVVAAAPAQASDHDCVILGPDYVGEVVDCAVFILERAIG